jgi:epoxide hydrolase-like predicted phosphatase
MTKRAVIFDFGGVLMKTRDYAPRHRWDDRLNLAYGSVERAVHNDETWRSAQIGAIPIETYWADVAARLNLTGAQVKQLAEDFYRGDVLDAQLIDLIKSLRAEGFTIALLSNDSVELRPKLERLGILELFDPLIITAEIGVMKPDTAAYNTVLERIRHRADESIFIDDRQENIEGAAAVGIHGIHYKDGMDLRAALDDLLYTE